MRILDASAHATTRRWPFQGRATNTQSPSTSRPSTPTIVTSGPGNLHAIKAHSTTQLPTTSSLSSAAQSQPHDRSRSDNLDFNTIPRSPTPLSNGSQTPPSSDSTHPDLSNEVAALSTKLINAINHQTNLDDSLQSTRTELHDANKEIDRLKQQVVEEKRHRAHAERQKRETECEIESLTSSLFEEANSMVAQARREHDDAEQRNLQLQSQLKNAETLLASHQEQLRELKDMMQQIQLEGMANEASAQPSVPSTPITGVFGKRSLDPFDRNLSTSSEAHIQISPDHPLSFSYLLSPILRSDLQGFDDFVGMLKAGQSVAPNSRTTSGNFSGLNVMGMGSLSNFAQSSVQRSPQNNTTTTTSNSSLASSSPVPQAMPGSFNREPSQTDFTASPNIASSLKDQKFYKRALQEDIEPTLRLDAAPGLSWLSRRNLVGSMVSGNLIVEPFGPQNRYWSDTLSCALCGESRSAEPYIRRHRFYKGDSDDAQRYMVCDYCLGRLRATGDFVNFLRMVRSGYWKSETPEDSKTAWEECTKLRERMFWARLGGGVVPTAAAPHAEVPPSPRAARKVSMAAESIVEEEQEPGPEAVVVQGTEGPVTMLRPPVPPGRVSAAGSPERSRDMAGSKSFLAMRSRFESISGASTERRPSTPSAAGASEQKRSSSPDKVPQSPKKSPSKTAEMPGSLAE